jgi:hypothetical protein
LKPSDIASNLGYHGYFNLIQQVASGKGGKGGSSSSGSVTLNQETKKLIERFEQEVLQYQVGTKRKRDFNIVTIVYLLPPGDKRLLSEDLNIK